MATFPGSYVPINAHSIDRINAIVDNMVTPRLLNFRQITVYDEKATNVGINAWKLSYPTWNVAFPIQVNLNGQPVTPTAVDYIMGNITLTASQDNGDVVNTTYNIDWFSIGILAGFIFQAIDVINNSGQASSATSYTINDAPTNWDGVIADLVCAQAMEKLLLDYDLWNGRLIFSIGANNLEDGGGDITSSLETLKANYEERANIALNNEKFKIGNLLAPPTSTYYAAVRGIGRGGMHGGANYGKLRGWKTNKYL
jgi:hypothetical protein